MPLESLIVEKTLSPTFPTRWRSSKAHEHQARFTVLRGICIRKNELERGRTP
ncbi:hypothetical protein COLSTE_01502 [Collinsella stercoris DSM 13279]|uniref:Uncharacterized protein n=1 Tax=Collinsella stercoris DSM 13279 TaxID=445975 RepID=B6GBN9_9ACTN|nr:hypothetical protein COLSTE_01502 [Collinsella stercoris DSM 13279]